MANTYQLIEAKTLATSTASVTFSSIASTYTDLAVKVSVRSTRTGTAYDDFNIGFNGSTASFTCKSIQGSGSSVSSFNSNQFIGQADTAANTANTFSSADIYIPNYASANYKSYSVDMVQEENGTTAYANLTAGLWSNTAAITSITFSAGAGNLAQYSTFYLYGIKNS